MHLVRARHVRLRDLVGPDDHLAHGRCVLQNPPPGRPRPPCCCAPPNGLLVAAAGVFEAGTRPSMTVIPSVTSLPSTSVKRPSVMPVLTRTAWSFPFASREYRV